MKKLIGEDPKTGVMQSVEVEAVPCPNDANPNAVEWVDAKGNVWAWSQTEQIGMLLDRAPAKGSRLVPMTRRVGKL